MIRNRPFFSPRIKMGRLLSGLLLKMGVRVLSISSERYKHLNLKNQRIKRTL